MWFCIDEEDNVAVGATALKAWKKYQEKFGYYPMHLIKLFDVTNVRPNKLIYAVAYVETEG